MKCYKKKYILLLLILCSPMFVYASCKPEMGKEVSYMQGNYGSVGYCDVAQNNMQNAGCMPTAYAILVANLYDSSVTPVTIRDEICNNSSLRYRIRGPGGNGGDGAVASYMFSDASDVQGIASKYQLSISEISTRDIDEIKNILKSGSMIVVSILCPDNSNGNDGVGCRFSTSTSGHYVVMANVSSDGTMIQVLNPGNSTTEKGSWDDDTIQQNIIDVVNIGMWEVKGTSSDCSKVVGISTQSSSNSSSTGSNGSSSSSSNGHIFSDVSTINTIDTKNVNCKNIFTDTSTGNLNGLGESLQMLFNIIKIAAVGITIILSSIDYIKAITAHDDSELKKANQRTIKRVIIGAAIFFLPFILDILFHLFGLYDISTCNIGS